MNSFAGSPFFLFIFTCHEPESNIILPLMQIQSTIAQKPPKGMLSIADVAAMTGKSIQSVKLYIAGGTKGDNPLIPDARINRRPYFKKATVKAYMKTLRKPGAPRRGE